MLKLCQTRNSENNMNLVEQKETGADAELPNSFYQGVAQKLSPATGYNWGVKHLTITCKLS